MKTLHYINFVLIFLIIISLIIIEDVLVSQALSSMQKDCYKIEREISVHNDLKNMKVCMLVDNIEYDWIEDEEKLCYLVHHKNIQEIGQEISKMKLYIASNDVDGFKVSLSTIKSYCHSYFHFMGASWHNIL